MWLALDIIIFIISVVLLYVSHLEGNNLAVQGWLMAIVLSLSSVVEQLHNNIKNYEN